VDNAGYLAIRAMTKAADRNICYGITHDFRATPPFEKSPSTVYGEALDLIAYADQLGFGHVWLSEHHFVADGYCPSPVAVAGAILARTRRIHVSTHALLLPLYNPVRLAEDVAVLDVISGGRMELGVALGYRAAEYSGLGFDIKERRTRMDEACDILVRAWTEDNWSYRGRHFDVRGVSVRPRPVQQPYPRLWIGAQTVQAAARAVRMRAPLLLPPPGYINDEAAVYAAYAAGLLAADEDPGRYPVAATFTCAITDDPAAYRMAHRDEWAYKAALYQEWEAGSQAVVGEAARRPRRSSGIIGSASECAAALAEVLAGDVPITHVVMNLRDPEQLRLFAERMHLSGSPPEH
jgi:alkanesulfonate monooxygenase SsuD/methylene tetrahydromethanopterin reductase-like flavin-dependent oxidoreductase (luciferase family)